MRIDLLIKRLRPDAVLPAYSHGPEEDAGLDLSYCGEETLVLPPLGRVLCPTGLAIQLPPGCEGQVRPRSGLALKHGLAIVNSPGTIDADYRGEVGIIVGNIGSTAYTIERGTRIAQLVIAPVVQAAIEVVATLDETARGSGGFGHTGSK